MLNGLGKVHPYKLGGSEVCFEFVMNHQPLPSSTDLCRLFHSYLSRLGVELAGEKLEIQRFQKLGSCAHKVSHLTSFWLIKAAEEGTSSISSLQKTMVFRETAC